MPFVPIIGFFLIALLYSGAGFAGGSSYLALLSLLGWKASSLTVVALSCNLVVSGQGVLLYGMRGYLKWKNALPFLVGSIPFALVGGMLKISLEIWTLILGIVLILSGAALLIPKPNEGESLDLISRKFLWPFGIGVGGILGFLAGLVGIGGGIFLSPLLHFYGYGKGREIAALASTFILMNSASGLVGQIIKSGSPGIDRLGLALMVAVLLGGQIGSRWATRLLSNQALRYWTAGLVVFAGGRILWKFF